MSQPTPMRAPRGGAHRRAAKRGGRSAKRWVFAIVLLLLVALVLGGIFTWKRTRHQTSTTAVAAVHPTSTTLPATTTSTTQAPGPGFVAGKITAVGDSVMIDYQDPLEAVLPGISVDASVSRQWSTGEQILSQLKGQDQLGATVIVALSTNGPIGAGDFDAMMSILSGASRVLFVNTHVDQPWQDPNNLVLSQGVARYPNAQLVDWYALASENPSWLGSDGTHLAINGDGAHALAALIASKLS
jgi:lysophospholipase L1-like esterase